MIFLDTGFLIAFAKPRDALHQRALAWLEHMDSAVVTTEYVLCETVDALSRPDDRPKAHSLLYWLREWPDCQIVESFDGLFASGIKLHAGRPDKAWSLTDCISFHVMQERGIHQALAYDIHFEQAGFEPLLRRDPPQ